MLCLRGKWLEVPSSGASDSIYSIYSILGSTGSNDTTRGDQSVLSIDEAITRETILRLRDPLKQYSLY